MENDISNYFMVCPDCRHEGRYCDTWSNCPHCGCRMSLMLDLNREQRELLTEAVARGQFTVVTEYELTVIVLERLDPKKWEPLLGSEQWEQLKSGQFVINTEDDLMLTIFTLIGMPLPKVPYAYFAQSCWYYLQHQPVTEKTNVAMKYYEERFEKSVANLAHVDEKVME